MWASIPAMEIQDLIKEYETKTNEELLRLALDSEQLTPEATTALTNELAKRRLSGTEQLNAFREAEEQRKVEQSRDPGTLFFLHAYGIGRKRFGKAEYNYSSDTGIERFRTTVFVVLFWLPLIPTGSFLVERKRKFLSNQMIVLEKCPLDWEQVLKVWAVAAASLLTLIWVFKLLPSLL
jgi:hypothetical protein